MFVVCYLGLPKIASLSFGKFPGGVGQLAAVCGLFLWGGEKSSGNGLCGGRVATVAAVCRNKKDYAIIKE